jgi:hypothetical protein
VTASCLPEGDSSASSTSACLKKASAGMGGFDGAGQGAAWLPGQIFTNAWHRLAP